MNPNSAAINLVAISPGANKKKVELASPKCIPKKNKLHEAMETGRNSDCASNICMHFHHLLIDYSLEGARTILA